MEKLIRDLIPEIMEIDGKQCNYYTAEEVEYKERLLDKLVEEANEVKSAKNRDEVVEELADLLEVIQAIYETFNIKNKEVLDKKLEKLVLKGRFDRRLVGIFEENK